MTVSTLEMAKELVDEIGADKVHSVYQYINANNDKKMYAVFIASDFVDIHNSPYVKDPVLLFLDGKWITIK